MSRALHALPRRRSPEGAGSPLAGVGSVVAVLAVVLAVVLTFPSAALANPTGEIVRHGSASFERSPGQLVIHQNSQRAVIDWQSFSIAPGETTRFLQPDAAAAVLNRVRGSSASVIEGALRANGQVYLINPNGILIGPGGTVDVGGFVASTLDVSDRDFLAGGDLRFAGNSAAAVVNLGSISAFDGDVILIASSVTNAGTIRAPRGTAALAAGNDVLLAETGEERVFVRSGDGGSTATNTGTIEANVAELKAHGGNVYGMAVRNEGRVAATGVTRQGGQIFLSAGGGKGGGGSGTVRSTGTLQARQADGSGGRIEIDAGTEGRAEVGGTIDASGTAPGNAASQTGGVGGEILILGRHIEVFDGALILNDGTGAGGKTRIGGGRRGLDPALANAEKVRVGSGARISAAARGFGAGGEVVVFASDTLRFDGHVSVAGAGGGAGGFVELSGQRAVYIGNLSEQVDLGMRSGPAGTLLLDPIDITIVSGVNDGYVDGTTIYDGSIIYFLENNGNLLIQTSGDINGNGGNGDLTLEIGVVIEWSGDSNLRFAADRDFLASPGTRIAALGSGSFSVDANGTLAVGSGATISTSSGEISLSGLDLVIDGAEIGAGGSGDLHLNAERALLVQNAELTAQQGSISLFGNAGEVSPAGSFTGVTLLDSLIENNGPGLIQIRGIGGGGGTPDFAYPGFSNPGAFGVRIATNTRIVSHDDASNSLGILIEGDGGWTGSGSHGILVLEGSSIETAGRSVQIIGYGGGDGNDPSSRGIQLDASTIQVGGDGSLLLTGYGSESYYGGGNEGVYLGGGSSLETEGGDLRVEGNAWDEDSAGILGGIATFDSSGGLIFLGGSGGWNGGAAIRFESPGARIGAAGDQVELASSSGDVLVEAQILAESLRLLDYGEGPSAGFSLENALNDVDLLATGKDTGTPGLYGVLGSLSYRDAGSFSLGENGIFAEGLVRLIAGGTLTIDAPLSSFYGNVELDALNLLVDAPVSAGGDLAIRFGSVNSAASGTATIRRSLTSGGSTTFTGGNGANNILTIDDSTLAGNHTYAIGADLVARNPSYRFANIQNLFLFLGPGDNTVNSGFYGYTQYLYGGVGFNTLNLPGITTLSVGSPIQNVHFSGFSAPLAPSGPEPGIGNGAAPDLGDLLRNQIDQNLLPNQLQNTNEFESINRFNDGAGDSLPQTLSRGALGLGGGGFPAAALGAVLGQAIVIAAEDGTYLVVRAFSLDGSDLAPSNFALDQLVENLGLAALLELRSAIGFEGAILLFASDAHWSLDLSGPPEDPAILTALLEAIGLDAARELSAALGIPLLLLVVAENGAVVIALDGDPIPAPLLERLAALLADDSLAELAAALGE